MCVIALILLHQSHLSISFRTNFGGGCGCGVAKWSRALFCNCIQFRCVDSLSERKPVFDSRLWFCGIFIFIVYIRSFVRSTFSRCDGTTETLPADCGRARVWNLLCARQCNQQQTKNLFFYFHYDTIIAYKKIKCRNKNAKLMNIKEVENTLPNEIRVDILVPDTLAHALCHLYKTLRRLCLIVIGSEIHSLSL